MKRVIILVALFLFPSFCEATIALVAHTVAGSGPNSTTTTAINSSGGNLILIGLGYYGTNAGAGSISDNMSNTITPLTSQVTVDAVTGGQIYYIKNPTVGSGHTFTVSGTLFYGTICVAVFSGADTTSPFDVQNGAASLASTLATGSVTPSQDNEVLFASYSDTTAAATIDLGFTISDTIDYVNNNNYGVGCAYLIQTTATAKNPTWTFGTPTDAAAEIATFKAAAVVSLSTSDTLPLMGM